MGRSLTILIQFQVSFLKVRRIQQSSQFEPCAVFFAAKVRKFCRRVSNLKLECVQTLPKCVEDSPSQAGVKSCTNIAQKCTKFALPCLVRLAQTDGRKTPSSYFNFDPLQCELG